MLGMSEVSAKRAKPSEAGEIKVLTSHYSPEPTGSAPPVTDFCRWMASMGATVEVLTPRPSYPLWRVFDGYRKGQRDREIVDGVVVRRLRSLVFGNGGVLSRVFAEASFAALLLILAAKPAKGGKAPYVLAVCPSILTAAAAPAFRQKGGRVVTLVHDVQSGLARALNFPGASMLSFFLKYTETWALNRCDAVLTLSEEMRNVLRNQGVRTSVTIVPPQVDTREIMPKLEVLREVPIILYSGNLGRKQGLKQVVDLSAALEERGVACQVIIRGAGAEYGALRETIAKLGLANLRLEPLSPREEMSDRLADAAIHLVPQDPRGATFAVPSKVYTIMAAARPFIGTAEREAPLARLATDTGAGACVPPYEIQALADLVEELLGDPARREKMGTLGRAYVEAEVDREVVCRRMYDVLTSRPVGVT